MHHSENFKLLASKSDISKSFQYFDSSMVSIETEKQENGKKNFFLLKKFP